MKTRATLLVIGSMALAACGDEEAATGPILPDAEWVKVSTFLCPEDAQRDEDCTIPVTGDTLMAGRIYIQDHIFINAEYLFGILSWPIAGASSCDEINSERLCVLFGVWGAFDFEFGNQRLAFRLADPIDYQFEYFLMLGGTTLVDTTFAWHVRSDEENGQATGSASETGFLER